MQNFWTILAYIKAGKNECFLPLKEFFENASFG